MSSASLNPEGLRSTQAYLNCVTEIIKTLIDAYDAKVKHPIPLAEREEGLLAQGGMILSAWLCLCRCR